MGLKKWLNSLIKRHTTINVDGWLTINVNDPNAVLIVEGKTKVQTEGEEPLWYIVDRHSNSRRKNADGKPIIFSDYNAASTRAAGMSSVSGWWVPMRISEYNDVFGRFRKED